MLKDRIALDLPFYDGLLVGHYQKAPGYTSRRAEGTDDWLLILTIDGVGRFAGDGDDRLVAKGTLALIPPGTPHDYGISRDADTWELLWVHFHPPSSWLEMLKWKPDAKGVAFLEPREETWPSIAETFWEIHREANGPSRNRLRLAMNVLEKLLILCDEERLVDSSILDLRIQRVVDALQGDLATSITLRSLSEIAFLSPGRFSHLFRDQMGMAPLQYVALQRIRRASLLLERTTLSIAEIASLVGMDPIQFSAKFKMETGMAPRDYRKQNRQNSV